MTDDHQYLAIAGGHDNFARVYQHTGSGYLELTTNTYPSYVWCSSFSRDQTYLAISTDSSTTHIYKYPANGSLTEESTVAGAYFNKISDKKKYLVTGLDGEARVYINDEF